MVQYTTCPGVTFDLLTNYNPDEVFNEHLSQLRNVPTKVIRVRNKDQPCSDNQCKRPFGLKQKAHLRWTRDLSRVYWEEFVCCQVESNETYLEAKRQFSDRNRQSFCLFPNLSGRACPPP